MTEPRGLLEALLAATHLVVPDDLPALVHQHAAHLGATTAVVHLVDLDQRHLVALTADGGQGTSLTIEGTVAGRCFRSMSMVETADASGRVLWTPIVDGSERLGVLQLVMPSADAAVDRELLLAFSGLVAELVMTKQSYGDFFEHARRPRPLTIAAELLWQLLPPITYGTEDLVIAAAFLPTTDLGGDAFDYGVDGCHAEVAIFDALGHGLDAGLMATTAVAAFRNGRRSRHALDANAERIGSTIAEQFGESRFVTGVLLSLDRPSGRLTWVSAGHPPPLLVRGGQVVKSLDAVTGMPFGVGPPSDVAEEQLEPGDRVLLYTDGVIEARTADGEFFGVESLVGLIARSVDEPPPEMLRRLMHAIEEHNDGPMRDDAMVVMVEWQGPGSGQLKVEPSAPAEPPGD